MIPLKILIVIGMFASGISNGFAQQSNTPQQIRYEDFDVAGAVAPVYKSADWTVWTLSGIGITSFGMGMALYSVGQSDEAVLLDVGRDSEGRIRSVTQRRAARMEDDAVERIDMGMSFMVGGAVIGGAAVLWYLYGQETIAIPSAPVESRVVPFGFMPRFELDVSRGGMQLTSEILF